MPATRICAPAVGGYDVAMSVRFPIVVSAVVTFMAGLPACDCGVIPLDKPPGRLAGTACDAETGEPVAPGTTITIEADGTVLTATVGDLGNYAFPRVPAGDVVVVLPVDRRQDTTVGGDESVEFIDTACRDISLEHPGSLSGKVCNAHVGDVVAGADVVIVLPDGTQLTTTTDAEGNFSFAEVPQGRHALSIRGDGYSKTELVEIGADEAVVIDIGDACAIPNPGDAGGVRGLVCAPDFGGLQNASVSITLDNGDVLEVRTGDDGRFVLDNVPAGSHTLVIQKGSFRAEQTVVIVGGEMLQLNEAECALEPDDIRVAFVTGSRNDHMRDVLGSLGIEGDFVDVYDGKHGSDASGGAEGDWALQLLSEDRLIFQYDIVFISCRAFEGDLRASSQMRDRLREFVNRGGSVYTSDQAYGVIEATWPERIDFEGDDQVQGAANKGESANNISAQIVDAGLAASFGGVNATLHYPLAGWSVVRDVANDVTVYAKADVNLRSGGGRVRNAPQMVGFKDGEGTVIYSSFHQEPGINPDQLRMLQILMFEL